MRGAGGAALLLRILRRAAGFEPGTRVVPGGGTLELVLAPGRDSVFADERSLALYGGRLPAVSLQAGVPLEIVAGAARASVAGAWPAARGELPRASASGDAPDAVSGPAIWEWLLAVAFLLLLLDAFLNLGGRIP
jgi:hypothetical protein